MVKTIETPIILEDDDNFKTALSKFGCIAFDRQANLGDLIGEAEGDLDLENGIYVVKINSDGPAYKTNIKTGDIITKIDGNTVNRMSELRNYIYRKKPGDVVTLTILRNKKEYAFKINLSKK